MLIDSHMHLEYGPLDKSYVMEFVNEAISKGLDEIHILDHSHRFIEFEPMYENLKKIEVQKIWLENKKMKFKDNLLDYVNLMEEIKKDNLPINIKYGLEICYTPQNKEFIKDVLKPYKFDFLVGAIHSIDGILYDMNFSKEILWDKFDTNQIYKRYYELVMGLIESDLFSQLAHPDTIKLFNYYPTYDLKDTYNLMAKKLNEHHMLAECNTGCYYRYNHKDLGLSDELLEILLKNNVEIITASDAHHPNDVGSYIKQANQRILNYKDNIKGKINI